MRWRPVEASGPAAWAMSSSKSNGRLVAMAEGLMCPIGSGVRQCAPAPSGSIQFTAYQRAFISENNGVLGVEIANEIGEQAVLAHNEPLPKPAK
jgi:hypothetical protein